jgi:NADPH2:quinone reductase
MASQPTSQPTTMRAVAIPRFGEAEVMELREHPLPQPGPGDVLLRVAAAGLNHGDTIQRRGNYPPPPGGSPIPGLEVSGTVAAVGPGVERWRPGDRACAILTGGGYAEYCIAPAGQCLPVPEGVDLVQAAALPEAFCTVWDAVWRQARLAPGQALLVHGGSSGIGVTALQLAHALGHPVYTTAGSRTKCEACTALGASRAVNYREEDFVAVVKDVTDGRGVDVVLDMVGGSYLARNIACLAEYGRHVSIGVQESPQATIDVRDMMRRKLTLIGTTLRARSVGYKTGICAALEREVWPLFAAGRLRPVVEQVFPLAEVVAAHRHLEAGGHIGKILLAV